MAKQFLILSFILLLFAANVFAESHHYYFNGKVQAVSYNEITVSGKKFTIATKSRIAMQESRKGAIFERPGSIYQISIGDYVTVRIEGCTVNEILIERWKR
jgi:myosin-crossreactive antigen